MAVKKLPKVKLPPEQFQVRIFLDSTAQAQEFLLNNQLDYGCRPSVRRDGDRLVIPALCAKAQITSLKRSGFQIEVGESLRTMKTEMLTQVGKGDRFKKGKLAPVGFGLKLEDSGQADIS